MPDRPTLIVMVKAPVAGRVKTRLGHDIGMVPAAWWFRHQTARLLRRIRDPRWNIVLSVAPDNQALKGQFWPSDLQRQPQGGGDLGQRMARAMRSVSTAPVCVIGADIPGITPTHIARAFASLGAHDAVFGPAEDGGYWLVGVKRGAIARPRMFQGVRWSTEHALHDSQSALSGWRIAQVDRLHDVDTLADLRALSSY